MKFYKLIVLSAVLATAPVAMAQTTFQVSVVPETNHPDPNAFPEVYEVDGVQGAELTLVRGQTYIFQMNNVAGDHPFFISTSSAGGDGGASEWTDGVTGNFATGNDTLTFVVPDGAPDLLYYQCSIHLFMGWKINIVDPVTFTCTAVGLPITIPAAGGFYAYDITIDNDGTDPETVDIWFNIDGPPPVDILRGPVTKTFQAGASFAFQLRTVIPGTAPAGAYTHTCEMGAAFPTADVGFFTWDFTKLAAFAGGPIVAGWSTEAELAAELDAAMLTAPASMGGQPSNYVLEGSYPNPFNPRTTIRFSLPESAQVRLVVYDVLGRQVRVLIDGTRETGAHEVVFDAGDLPSGTYLYRLETPQGSFVHTMMLAK